MKQYVAVLGHQPHISLAELESRYPEANIVPLGKVGLLDVEPDIQLLGGTPKVAEVVELIQEKDKLFPAIEKLIRKQASDSKINLGLSFYVEKDEYEIFKEKASELTKSLKSDGVKLRFIPNRTPALNSAQVWHNKLLLGNNVELLIISDKSKFIIAKTKAVQNIRGYTIRDRSKPARDAKVGMLPPKLAKSMLSLASPSEGSTILDPFCGSGTVLMEALLDGHKVVGTDLSENMVEASRANLDWLAHNMKLDYTKVILDVGDAQNYQWPEGIDAVVSEIYLGPPLRRLPNKEKLAKINSQVNSILKQFLTNIHPQLKAGSKLVLAVPAWSLQKNRGYRKLKAVDELGSLGYNLVDLKLADSRELIYHRPNQVVARQLIILEKK